MKTIASYTKSGGSWLHWILIDWLHSPDLLLDLEDKTGLDRYIKKTERPLAGVVPDIHLVRHPLDLCYSLYNYLLLTNRATENEKEGLLDSFVEGNLSLSRTKSYFSFMEWAESAPITIRYEDLNKDPVKTLGEVQKLNPDKPIQPSIEKYSLENVRARESQVKFSRPTNKKYSFFNKASSFYYAETLSEKQIDTGFKTYDKFIRKYWPETIR